MEAAHIKNKVATTPSGEILKEELKDRGYTQKEFAALLGIAPSHLSEFIRGRRPFTAQIALKLESMLGISHVVWYPQSANMEANSQIVSNQSEKIFEAKETIKQLNEYVDTKYLLKMEKATRSSAADQLQVLRDKYNLRSPEALCERLQNRGWFRKSAKTGLDSKKIATWVIYARQKAKEVQVSGSFKGSSLDPVAGRLAEILHDNNNPLVKVREVLSSNGIRFLHVPKIEHASIDGYSFVEEGTPTIVLTLRYNRIDNLAFNVLHELCHIYRHLGGDDEHISLATEENEVDAKEKEADEFASNTLIPNVQWKQAPSVFMNPFAIQSRYSKWAEEQGFNKWIVLGRISHETGMYMFKSDPSRYINNPTGGNMRM